MIENAYKNQNWHAVYTFGAPLSTPLWKMSKLSLRIKVAEKVKDAIIRLGKEGIIEINDKKCDVNKELASLFIDDFGYTNYILGNLEEGKRSVYIGLESYADKISLEEDKLIIKLKGYRHLLAMCSNQDIVEKEARKIYKQFRRSYVDAWKYMTSNYANKIEIELLYAKYALIKHNYQTKLKDSDTTIKRINQLIQKLNDKKKFEWVEKCEQLIWEINLKEGKPGNNVDSIVLKIEKRSIFPNRFLKIVNLFLDYKIFEAKNYHFKPNRFGTNDQLEYLYNLKSEVKKVIKKASDVIAISEDRISLENYKFKKTEFFKIINRRIREAKRKWLLDQYNIILIDFDYTIFNYRKAQVLALRSVFKEYSLKYKNNYADIFRKINDECWLKYKNAFDFNLIKTERVTQFAKEIGISERIDIEAFVAKMDEYMARPVFMPGVKQFLKKCKGKHVMVVTDASKERREKALKKLKNNVIEQVFSSEDCSMLKSNKEYFRKALEKIDNNVEYTSVLVIGDGVDTDIKGAQELDLDTCFIKLGYKLREDKVPDCKATYVFDTFNSLNKAKIKLK